MQYAQYQVVDLPLTLLREYTLRTGGGSISLQRIVLGNLEGQEPKVN